MQSARFNNGIGRHATVSVWNRTRLLSDESVRKRVLGALQTQIRRDFSRAWGVDATLEFTPFDSAPRPGRWRLILLEEGRDTSVDGFHELTRDGLPQAMVFVENRRGMSEPERIDNWTLSVSHELLEMLVDPYLNLTAVATSPDVKAMLKTISSGKSLPRAREVFCALEVCDPCSSAENGYRINGTLVSNFVYPAWFESRITGAHRVRRGEVFDHRKSIERPFAALSGGYAIVYSKGSWSLHAGRSSGSEGRTYNRWKQRNRNRHQWRRSEH